MLKKTDKNQIEIVNTFRKLGYSVCDLSTVGRGFPDLLIAKHNQNHLVEVKNPNGKNKIGDKQRTFADTWNADVHIVRTIEDVIKLHEKIK